MKEGKDQPQLGDGYKCDCGFITDDKTKFLLHIAQSNKRDGKGAHKSLGRVNVTTGDITMPPWKERTPEQQEETTHGRKALKIDSKGKTTVIRTTDILAQASEIKFIPRIFTCTYTPIMQAGMAAAANIFRWRPDMPLENFLDTVIYNFFKEHGVRLAGYIVDDSLLNAPVDPEDHQTTPENSLENDEKASVTGKDLENDNRQN